MVQRPRFSIELKKGQYLADKWSEESPGKGVGGKRLAGKGRPFGRSYETATHSYLIIEKLPRGKKNKDNEVSSSDYVRPSDSWARIMRTPMKRDKHVVMEVCAPSTNIEQWTITRSFDRQAYHDARKASGGDLWALGAKNIQLRGGNRVALAKVGKAMDKKNKRCNNNIAEEILEESDRVIDVDNENGVDIKEVVKAEAWAGIPRRSRRNPNFSRGHDPTEDEDESDIDEYYSHLEQYFEELGQDFQESARLRKQEKKHYEGEVKKQKALRKW
jgi:hypothetical protein